MGWWVKKSEAESVSACQSCGTREGGRDTSRYERLTLVLSTKAMLCSAPAAACLALGLALHRSPTSAGIAPASAITAALSWLMARSQHASAADSAASGDGSERSTAISCSRAPPATTACGRWSDEMERGREKEVGRSEVGERPHAAVGLTRTWRFSSELVRTRKAPAHALATPLLLLTPEEPLRSPSRTETAPSDTICLAARGSGARLQRARTQLSSGAADDRAPGCCCDFDATASARPSRLRAARRYFTESAETSARRGDPWAAMLLIASAAVAASATNVSLSWHVAKGVARITVGDGGLRRHWVHQPPFPGLHRQATQRQGIGVYRDGQEIGNFRYLRGKAGDPFQATVADLRAEHVQ